MQASGSPAKSAAVAAASIAATAPAASPADTSGLMRAAAFNSFGGPEVLQACLWSKPQPAKGRVLVRVAAAGVNPIDCKCRAGQAFPFTPMTRLPKIPGGDLAGLVEQASPGRLPLHTGKQETGDRVFACSDSFFPHKPDGSYAELVSVAEEQLALMPHSISFEEAAVLPLVSLTAWQGIDDLPLPAGSRILVHGASGGVGSMAVQLAKRKGWHVVATCSPKNAAYVKQLGADEAEDYKDPRLYERYRQAPFDCVFDVIGGTTMRRSLSLLKRSGYLVEVWTNAEQWIKDAGSDLRGKLASVADLARIKLRGMLGLGPQLRFVLIQPNGAQLAQIASLLETRALHAPRISRAFSLDRAGDAHAYAESGHAAGKVLIKVARL